MQTKPVARDRTATQRQPSRPRVVTSRSAVVRREAREPRARLLVFGINYAPEATGIALNTTWQTRTLTERGWDVAVVTGVPHYPAWRPLPLAPAEAGDGPPVSRHRHYIPQHQTAVRRGAYELTWLLSALPAVARKRALTGVLAVVPALSGAVLAAAAAARNRVPYAIVFQDVMGRAASMSGMPGASTTAAPVRAVELALARRAAGVAIVGEGFRSYFLEGGVDPDLLQRIHNPARLGPIRERRERVRARMGWGDDQFVVVHSGSMGHKQGLEYVLAAADRAREQTWLRFALQGDGNQRETLEREARRLRLPNVDFLPVADSQDLPGILASADALLLCQRASVVNMSMPAKLGSYLLAGVPVLAAVADDDETALVVCEAGGFVTPPDAPAELLATIAALHDDAQLAAHAGTSGRSYAKTHFGEDAAIEGVERFLLSAFSHSRTSSPKASEVSPLQEAAANE